MRRRVFVLSCGRSGSTALATYVRAIEPDFWVRHEPFLWLLMRRMSMRLATGKSSTTDGYRLLSTLRYVESLRTQGTYIETTPALWGFTPIVPSVFPDCALIHIVRHPFDYLASAVRFKSQSDFKGFMAASIPDLFPAPRDLGLELDLQSMSPADRAAWLWSVANDHILNSAEEHGLDIHRFHFDNLFGRENDPSEVRDLAALLGIRNPESFLHRLQDQPVNAAPTALGQQSRTLSEALQPAVYRRTASVALRCGHKP